MLLSQLGVIIASIAAIIVCIFLVSKFQNWFTKNRLILLFILLAFGMILYGYGYLIKYPESKISAVLMAVFSTGRMLVLENDYESISAGVEHLPIYNLFFSMSMTLTMLTLGMVALSYSGYRVMCKIQVRFLRIFTLRKKVFLFSLINERAMILAKDIKKSHKRAIIIFCVPVVEEEEDKLLLEREASQQGFFVIPTGEDIGSGLFKLLSSFASKKLYLFLMGNEMDNLSLCSELEKVIHKSRRTFKELNSYVWIQNGDFASVLDQEKYAFMDIHCIDEAELCSRKLFDDLTLRSYKKDQNLKIGLIGWTFLSEEILNYAIMLGQFQDSKIEITLMDHDIKNKSAMYFVSNPEIWKVADFRFIDTRESTRDFFQTVESLLGQLDIMFYLNENLEIAAALSRLRIHLESSCRIACYFGDKPEYQEVLSTKLFSDIHIFGNWQELYTDDLIIDEKLDFLAKSFHQFYATLYQDTRSWDDIPLFEKQSNRALALSIQSKLHDLGLFYGAGDDVSLFEDKIKEEACIRTLTLEEHLRWNAFYFVNGYCTLNMDNPDKKTKDTFAKKHVCLVSFEDLLTVGAYFEKDYQSMDRYLVSQIGTVLKKAGFGIYPLPE